MFKKILFLDPKHGSYMHAVNPGLAYLASALEAVNVEVKIIDCQMVKDYKREIANQLDEFTTIGITANVGNITSAREIGALIRKINPQSLIIWGGAYSTICYEKLIPEYSDVVVIGEGEDTICELAKTNNFEEVKGVAYWDGSLKVNARRPLIDNLDRLKFPAWHLFDLKRYNRSEFARSPYGTLITSRGCPYNCIYCTKFIHGSKIRLRSIKNVIDEIDYLIYKYNTREVCIPDDNFTFYPERVKSICEEIIKKNYRNVRFSLPGGIRADKGDLEMFKLMKRAQFHFVHLAFESGSQRLLDKIGKDLDLERARKLVMIIKKTGLRVGGFFMLGLPYDTKETMRQTIDLAKSLPLDIALFFISVPFPGTDFYEIVRKNYKLVHNPLSESSIFEDTVVYETENFTAGDVRNNLKMAFREFYLRPSQIYRSITWFENARFLLEVNLKNLLKY